jgi:Protein of unknown function (DUF3759)
MFGFGDSQNAYDQVESGNHASLSHEAIAAAASFEVSFLPSVQLTDPVQAMKTFENHQRKEGEQVSHGLAKELLAGFAVPLSIMTVLMTSGRCR